MYRIGLIGTFLAAAAGCGAALEPTFGPQGQLTELRAEGHPLLTEGGLYLALPGWQGGIRQDQATEVKSAENEGVRTYTGRLVAGDIDATFTETVKRSPERIDLGFELVPARALRVEAVLYRFSLPIRTATGGRWSVGPRRGEFPTERPEHYILANEASDRMGWAGKERGLLALLTSGPVRCQLQDNRQFNGQAFEFQFYMRGAGELRPGEPIRFRLALEPVPAAEFNQRLRPAGTQTQPRLGDERPMRLEILPLEKDTVPRYGRIELALDLAATYTNPFDPEEIDVQAEVTAPSGRTFTVPAFFWCDYERELRGNQEVLKPVGEPGWRLRICPTEVGRYQVLVKAKDRTGTAQAGPVTLEAVPSEEPGFVRVSRDDPRYFAFDDGSPYFALGANVCWGGGRGTFDYDAWLPRYGAAGCNYFRVWLGPAWTTFALERVGDPEEGLGVGRFDLANAWRLDTVLDLAEQHGLYVMLCLDSYNELRYQKDGAYPFWENTPHNAANGGPLAEPQEFWTDETMKRLYRNKLRYLVARYGARTHVLSWEFWNEVDIISPAAYRPEEVRAWHAEMGNYLREIDPYDHLITTSFAGSGGRPEIDALPQIDYVQTHNYGSRDIAAALSHWQRAKDRYGKPHYVGEFGTDAGGGEAEVDPTGIALHNGLWATVMAGSAGTGMLWWWDNHIHPNNLYHHFAAVARFIARIDWPRAGFRPLDQPQLSFQEEPAEPVYVDLALEYLPAAWEESPLNQPVTLTVARDGTVTNRDRLSGVLHGLVNHPTWHNPATFELDLAKETEFVVRVSGASGYGGAHLVVKLDGETVIDQDMPDTNPPGQHDTLRQYNGDYPVTIPAGRHTVAVENTGKDWIFIEYRLKGGIAHTAPLLRVLGLQNDRLALAWVQQPEHTWFRVGREKQTPHEVPPTVLTLRGFRAGTYRAEVWDTYEGVILDTQTLQAGDGIVRVKLSAVAADVAVKVRVE